MAQIQRVFADKHLFTNEHTSCFETTNTAAPFKDFQSTEWWVLVGTCLVDLWIKWSSWVSSFILHINYHPQLTSSSRREIFTFTIEISQGGQSGCRLADIDLKFEVAFHKKEFILRQNFDFDVNKS